MSIEEQQKIVAIARSLIGRPYVYGAKPEQIPDAFDCSLLTQHLMREIGIEIPRSALLQAGSTLGTEVVPSADCSNLEPGDLIFARGTKGHYDDELFGGRTVDVGHVAMYIGGGKIIHARRKLGGVAEQTVAELVAEPHFGIVFARRFS